MKRIYLDHAATTPALPQVIDRINEVLKTIPGNPSSIHNEGRTARFIIEDSREKIAQKLNRKPSEIIFTSGATESINSVLTGLFLNYLGKDIVYFSAKTEHHATSQTLQYLEKKGAKVLWQPVRPCGEIIFAPHDSIFGLHSYMWVNNELGTILDISSLHSFKDKGLLIHLDAVQALGKIDFTDSYLADYISISGHKLGGPKGIGLLIVKEGTEFEPMLHGGAHERNRRAGTESVHQIAGLSTAVELAVDHQLEGYTHAEEIMNYLKSSLLTVDNNITFNSPQSASPFILNFTYSHDEIEGIDGEAVIMALDAKGISVSNGSACASGTLEPSHVLKEIGLSDYQAQATMRVSIYHTTTKEEIEKFVEVLSTILKNIRSLNRI